MIRSMKTIVVVLTNGSNFKFKADTAEMKEIALANGVPYIKFVIKLKSEIVAEFQSSFTAGYYFE